MNISYGTWPVTVENIWCSSLDAPYRIVEDCLPRRAYYRLKLFITPFDAEDKMNDILFMSNDEIITQEEKCIKLFQEDEIKERWKYTYLKSLYAKAIQKQFPIMEAYKRGEKVHFDAGFDLFCPSFNDFKYNGKVCVVDHRVCCSMEKVEYDPNTHKEVCNPVGYYIYPRSSTGTKTPLALTNSAGIIDSGYRGHLMTAFHCVRAPQAMNHRTRYPSGWTNDLFQRLVQICPPDLSYPIEVVLVDSLVSLGETVRGSGGFGSTGK
jgi:dUTP pyrophosphatase